VIPGTKTGMFIAASQPVIQRLTGGTALTPSTQISRPNPPLALSAFQPSALENLIHHLDGMAYRGRDDPARRMQFVSRGCLALSGYSAAVLMASDAGWMG
jgi:hypothetical protein